MTEQQKGIGDPLPTYNEMEKERGLCRSLMGGTRAMRTAGEKYLPKEQGEEQSAYDARLGRSFLYNGFKRAVKVLVGITFSREIVVEEVDDETLEWSENIDSLGRNLNTFSQNLLRDMLSEGATFVFVDFPQMPDGATQADAAAMQTRPYFTHVPSESVIYWRFESRGSHVVLAEARILEVVEEPDGEFHHKEVQQIRRLMLEDGRVNWEIWRKDEKTNEWMLLSAEAGGAGIMEIDEIPLVPFYAEQTGNFEADPPLIDLGYTNQEHWQSASDQRNILHIARVPFLFGAGLGEDDASDEGQVVLSAQRMWTADNPSAKVTWVEHTGASIEAGREDLKDKEDQMGALGLRMLLAQRPGEKTATENAIDKAEQDSELRTIADNLCRGLEKCYELAGKWEDKEIEADVHLDASFEMIMAAASDIPNLIALAQFIGADAEFVLEEAKRWGFLSANLDVEALLPRLQAVADIPDEANVPPTAEE